ncbi:hypothetical protein NPIL_287511 [Nephila pilipes]|uniref:Uncharacterized protein n=1 Tax=Nephila pilipes TaxID=299642 RepID=A0A8X6PDG0_NEPPI|nr:hypothetical protein NPIL_287511 [Nephila pilipes]
MKETSQTRKKISFSQIEFRNRYNRKLISYPDNISLAILPFPHTPNVTVPQLQTELQSFLWSLKTRIIHKFKVPIPNISPLELIPPPPSSRAKLNDLTRVVGHSKKAAELLDSRLKEKLIGQKNPFCWYRD